MAIPIIPVPFNRALRGLSRAQPIHLRPNPEPTADNEHRVMVAAAAVPLVPIRNTGSVPADFLPRRENGSSRLGLSRPSWIVKTESNVRKEKFKKPDPPCVVCSGSGRIDCHHCRGRGRTNCVHLAVLPKGEWPKWCKVCGGSGLGYCNRCLGTGEYRDIMGFHFMKMDTNPS